MKKVLSLLSAFLLTTTGVISVVACAPKEEKDVLFLLPGIVIGNTETGWKKQAYEKIVEEFNQSEEMVNSSIKVKAKWEVGDAVERRYNGWKQTSNEKLPDLYVSYADSVSRYVVAPDVQNEVRNMEATITGSTEQTDEFRQQFWSDNFYQEGLIKNNLNNKTELYVLPMMKSFDLSILNVKVFLELVSFIDQSWATILGNRFEAENLTSKKTHLFKPLTADGKLSNGTELNPQLMEALKASLQPVIVDDSNGLDGVRKFFLLNDNLLNLTKLYNQLFKVNLDNDAVKKDYIGQNGDLRKLYALGLESPSNRIYMEYADAMNRGNINPLSSADSNFLYNIENLNPNNGTMDLYLQKADSPIFSGINKFFNELRNLAPKTGTTSDERWSGVINHGKTTSKDIVAGTYFVQGTMLLTSGTSAGTLDYNPDRSAGVTIPQFDRDKDLMILPTATANGNRANFLQQGAGIAGFKSTGSNASQKEKVVSKFLKYLLEPINQNRFAIMSGYVPSTKKALEMYQVYKRDDYHNDTNSWKTGVVKPDNAADYVPIVDVRTHQPKNERDLLITDFLKNYATKDNVNIVTTSPNPLGSVIRLAIDRALRTYIFKDPTTYGLEDLLKNELDSTETLINQISYSLPDTYNNTFGRISFR